MTLSALGIFSAAGSSQEFSSDYEWIATANGTGSSGVITFSSLPTTYRHLQIRYVAKNTGSETQFNLTFNAVGGTSYARHTVIGESTVASGSASFSRANINFDKSMAPSTTASLVGAGIIDILDYNSSTKNKTVKALSGRNLDSNSVAQNSGAMYNTQAITSITLTSQNNNFGTLTRFALYGIKD